MTEKVGHKFPLVNLRLFRMIRTGFVNEGGSERFKPVETMNTKHLTQQADRALRLAARCGDDAVAQKLRTIAKEYLAEAEPPRQDASPQDRDLKKDRG